jgi:hypothetical protein
MVMYESILFRMFENSRVTSHHNKLFATFRVFVGTCKAIRNERHLIRITVPIVITHVSFTDCFVTDSRDIF